MHRMGTWYGKNYYNQATYNAVKNFQRRHGLKAKAWQGRKAHVEAMINQAYKYMGKPWLAGCSSSPAYGVDYSGLVMQGLYAGELVLSQLAQSVTLTQATNGTHAALGQTSTSSVWHILKENVVTWYSTTNQVHTLSGTLLFT